MSNPKLYPLKFEPILKDKIWGGEKLKDILDKPTSSKECGESWELSGVNGDISVASEGALKGRQLTDLIETYKGKLIGDHVFNKFGNDFPLLIKFIDANQDLSIQVHPNDEMAKRRHNSFGKTEMWYVVNAEPGATLISGFNKPTNKEEYLEYFNSGKLTDLLNKEIVHSDDVFFLPAGRVHTIGKGLLIAEIQQTSDITYRIYDFDRVDANGNKRELHVEEALDAIDFTYYNEYKTPYDKSLNDTQLVSCNYFTTNKLVVDSSLKRNYEEVDSFVVLMCLQGEGFIDYGNGKISYQFGDTILIPNVFTSIKIDSSKQSKLLEVYVP